MHANEISDDLGAGTGRRLRDGSRRARRLRQHGVVHLLYPGAEHFHSGRQQLVHLGRAGRDHDVGQHHRHVGDGQDRRPPRNEQLEQRVHLQRLFQGRRIANADGTRTRTRSAERFQLSAKAAFKLLEDGNRAFLLGSHVNDKFGAYTRYSTLAVGYGTQLLKREDKSVDVELGPGYFHGESASGEQESGMTVHGAAQLRWRVSPSAAFSQTVSVERGTSNVHTVAETALSTKINGTMQMKAAFSARSDSKVPEDKKNTDTQTSLTLVYSF
jgi:putative salt-induced outer membrane protein YdiY